MRTFYQLYHKIESFSLLITNMKSTCLRKQSVGDHLLGSYFQLLSGYIFLLSHLQKNVLDFKSIKYAERVVVICELCKKYLDKVH